MKLKRASKTTGKGRAHGGHSHGGHSHGATDGDGDHLPHPGHGAPVHLGFVPSERPPGTERAELEEGAGNGKVLFLDMPSGIAGDMTLAALFDLGVPPGIVQSAIEKLGLSGIGLTIESGYAGAIGCTHVNVTWPEQAGERSYREIRELISSSKLAEQPKELALRIFQRLADAEANVHRTTIEDVHFHEVGAVDAIVDIVGSAVAFCFLGAEVVASPVPLGRGFVKCRHGVLPLPAPATLNCLVGVPTIESGLEAELVTPTGAAIVATVADRFSSWAPIAPIRIGWGAGTRGLPDRPNALRVILGDKTERDGALTHSLLEANVDDMTGEVAAFALAQVLEAGAVDAWIVPATMKKGRPGMVFCALSPVSQSTKVAEVMLRETSTIGVRQSLVSRHELSRRTGSLDTPWGPVRIKWSGEGTSQAKVKPEFDDCARIAAQEHLPLRQVLSEVTRLAELASEKPD